MPKTLLARAFLLIVILIVLSLTAAFAIFGHAQQEPRTRQMAQLVVSVVNLTRAAVMSSAPEWRAALLSELADAEGMRVHVAELDEVLDPLPERDPQLKKMMDKVRASLGSNTRFASRRNGVEALWVSFYIGSDEFWVALPSERIAQPVSQVVLVWGGVVLLLALMGAYFIARQVAHPLGQLALAAKLVGQGKTPPPLSERGAQEVVAVSAAFNQMSADLAVNEKERAEVLAGISHDLRTPLARVRLAAELSGDEAIRSGLILGVDQMDSVVRQFLDYARPDQNEIAVPTALHALVADVVRRFSDANIALDLQPVPDLVLRPLLLKRALANLLDNAIKYGNGEVALQLYREDSRIVLAVLDRGPGIPESQRDAVKRPFVRLESARSNVTGSGLGLAIVERAVRLNGGELRLESREGGGLRAELVLSAVSM